MWISLGNYNHGAGRIFTRTRLLIKGHKWTPFVRLKFRYEFWQYVADLLPRRLVYFALIRAVAHATQGKWGHTEVPKIPAMEVASRWEYIENG